MFDAEWQDTKWGEVEKPSDAAKEFEWSVWSKRYRFSARAALLAVLPSARTGEREKIAKAFDGVFEFHGDIGAAIRALTDSEETRR